jgi:PEGA domain.
MKRKIFSSNTVRSAAPPEQFAILTIRSNVRNDNVFIDGTKKGSTRIDEKLSIGKHTISVRKKGI